MKKQIAFLLCLAMLMSLLSCQINNIPQDSGNHTTDTNSTDNSTLDFDSTNESEVDTPSTNAPVAGNPPICDDVIDYNRVLDLYYEIINICQNYSDTKDAHERYAEALGITDKQERELFSKLLTSTYLYYPGRGEEDSDSPHYKRFCGYAAKDLNGDWKRELVLLNDDYSVLAVFSMSKGRAVLLDHYTPNSSCWIDGRGWLHKCESGGADASTHKVYQIAQGRGSLELIAEYGMDGHEWIDGVAVPKYYKLENGRQVNITEAEYLTLCVEYGTYLGVYSGPSATKEYSGLVFAPLFAPAEEMLASALKNEIQVLETGIISFNYLRDCETPYNRIPLWELEDLRYSYMDVDGDTVKELVLLVDGGDTLILRYYKGRVYVYSFTFRNMDQLNTDGSYNWNHTGQNFKYGESQLAFDGAELKSRELWRVINDGEPDAEYYIDGKQVSCEELLSYYEEHPKTKVEFSPLTFSLENAISPRDALKIADEYWGGVDGGHDVAAGTTFIYRVVLASQPNAVSPYYRIEFQKERYNHWEEGWESRPPYHVDVYKEVLVNIYTGKCEPYIEFEPDGK